MCNWVLHFEQCNQCGRCQQVAPPGSLKIEGANFHAFQEACAISTSITLSTFAPGKATHLSLATHMTPVCDCFGFTGMPILPDVGIFGSDDIVAIEQGYSISPRASGSSKRTFRLRWRCIRARVIRFVGCMGR